MEYPFKDLMPLDEVLEREGYYKDWTHLDPKTFYSIVQISEMIKTKGYGTDVRLLISQLAEHFGLSVVEVTDIANGLIERQSVVENRQDAVENFNNQVIQEMTDKDVISAPELIQSRDGEATLQQRLNRDIADGLERETEIVSSINSRGVSLLNYKHLATALNDWTLALQTALDENSHVFIPKVDHEYYLGEVTLNSDNFITSNFAEIKRKEVTMYSPIFQIPETEENIIIDGLIIDGNKQGLGLHDDKSFNEISPNGKNILLQNLRFKNTIRSVVSSSQGRYVTFRDSTVDTFRGHVFYGSTNARDLLAENIISHNDDWNRGTYKMRDGARNMTLKNCKHYGTGSFMQLDTRQGADNYGLLIDNCYGEVEYDVIAFLGEGTSVNRNITVLNSVFVNTGEAARPYFNLSNGSPKHVEGMTVRDCFFYDFDGEFSFKGGTQRNQFNKKILLDGNHFYARDWENMSSTRPAFTLTNCEDITIVNNLILGSEIGIYHAPESINTKVKDNVFKVKKAIYISPNALYSGNNFIDGNKFICDDFISGAAPGYTPERRKLFIRDNESSTLTSTLDTTTWGARVVKSNNFIGD